MLEGYDNRRHTILILIDLQKAYNTSRHTITLGELRVLGFSLKAITYFKLRLSISELVFQIAHFKVDINTYFSNFSKI